MSVHISKLENKLSNQKENSQSVYHVCSGCKPTRELFLIRPIQIIVCLKASTLVILCGANFRKKETKIKKEWELRFLFKT